MTKEKVDGIVTKRIKCVCGKNIEVYTNADFKFYTTLHWCKESSERQEKFLNENA